MSNELAISLTYPTVEVDAASGDCIVSMGDVEHIVARLKEGIAQQGMWLIHEINPQQLLRKESISMLPARQLLYFHPRYMRVIIENAPLAIIEVPLKLLVFALPDGRVVIRRTKVIQQLAPYPSLTELAVQLEALSHQIVIGLDGLDGVIDRASSIVD